MPNYTAAFCLALACYNSTIPRLGKYMPESARKLKVFLCHASQDKPIVRDLYRRLAAEPWIDPWLDEEKLLPGQDWEYEIEKALDESDAVCVCISNNSVSKEGFVQRELRFVIDMALEKPEGTIYILPVRLNDCQPPRKLRTYHYADYFPQERQDWAYERICKSLQVRAKSITPSPESMAYSPKSIVSSPAPIIVSQPGTYLMRSPRIVEIDGKHINNLTELEFELLFYLYGRRSRVCTKAELVSGLLKYEYDVTSDEVLQALISRLRKKIEPDSHHPRYIITVHGEGYKFILPTAT